MSQRAPSAIRLVTARRGWPRRAAAEATRLRRHLGSALRRIDHIGSTAVAGLAAKPVIDLLLVVDNLAAFDRRGPCRLARLGYRGHGEHGIRGRRFFQKGGPIRPSYHLHVYGGRHHEIRRHLVFRDDLAHHPMAARAYVQHKQRAAACHGQSRLAYAAAKQRFIADHERRALRWARLTGR